MDVFSALEVLRNAPRDVLLAHGHEAILILREVEERIAETEPTSPERVSSPCCLCHRPAVCSNAYKTTSNSSSFPIIRRRQSTSTSNFPSSVMLDRVYTPPRSDQTPTASSEPSAQLSPKRKKSARTKHKDPANQVTALLNSIIDAVPWMLELCKKRPAKLVRARQSRRKNRRLEDIRRVQGDEKASNTDKLFRGVAQRSLSLQFVAVRKSAGDVRNGARSRDAVTPINAQIDERSLIEYGRGGGIAEYVRGNSDIEADDEQFAIQCIRAGNKLLEVERVLRIKMRDAGRTGRVSAISALTCLHIRRFRYLNLTAIPQFVESLFKETSKIELPSEEGESSTSLHILDAIEQMSQWFEELQKYYDRYVPLMQEAQVPSPGRARTLSPTDTSEAAQSSDCEVEGTSICRSEMASSPESCNVREDTPPTTDDASLVDIESPGLTHASDLGQTLPAAMLANEQSRPNQLAPICSSSSAPNISTASSDRTWQELQASWLPAREGRKRQRTADVLLLSDQLLPNSYPVLPAGIPGGHDEQPNVQSAQTMENSSTDADAIIQHSPRTTTQEVGQSFQAGRDTALHPHPTPRCNLDECEPTQSVSELSNQSTHSRTAAAPNLDHHFDPPTELSLTYRGEITHVRPTHGPGSWHRTVVPTRETPQGESPQICDTRIGDSLVVGHPSPQAPAFDEEDLIEQIATRPYDCRTAVQGAFDASIGLEYLSTAELFNE